MEDIKMLVSNEDKRVELHQQIGDSLQELLDFFESEKFENVRSITDDQIRDSIKKCEEKTQELCKIQSLLGFWATDKQEHLFPLIIESLCTELLSQNDNNLTKFLKWHAVRRLFYCACISCIITHHYERVYQLFNMKLYVRYHERRTLPLFQILLRIVEKDDQLYRKLLADKDARFPISQYMLDTVKPIIKSSIYSEPLFERAFHELEILLALEYIHQDNSEIPERVWAPSGLFAKNRYEWSSLRIFEESAESEQEDYPPLSAGFINGNYKRLKEICTAYKKELRFIR